VTNKTIKLDVRELPPPEPMTQILLALSQLIENQTLEVTHRREPFPLYEKLEENGWKYRCEKIKEDHFVIKISKHSALSDQS